MVKVSVRYGPLFPRSLCGVLVFGSASRPRRLHDRTPILIIVRLLGAEILDHLKTKNMFSPINSTSKSTNPTLKKQKTLNKKTQHSVVLH